MVSNVNDSLSTSEELAEESQGKFNVRPNLNT